MLLQARADANAADDRGNTPMHFALLLGHPDIAKVLEGSGGAIDGRNNSGETPLLVVAKALLANNVGIVQSDHYRKMLFNLLAEQRLSPEEYMEKLSKELPELRNSISQADNDGNTPLKLAESPGADGQLMKWLSVLLTQESVNNATEAPAPYVQLTQEITAFEQSSVTGAEPSSKKNESAILLQSCGHAPIVNNRQP